VMASRAVGCTLLCVLLDVALSTVLYLHGSDSSILREELLHFNILDSLLDLWGAALLRLALLLGACLGVFWNREEGPRRVAAVTPAVVLVCLTASTYTLAKLLLLLELRPLAQQPWALGLLCWTFASCLGLLLLWKLLGKVPEAPRGHSGRSDSSDTEKLVKSECEGESGPAEGPEETPPNSGATLGRLLAYSRKDAGLLSVAGLFLLISAVCEVFIPFYYGRAIGSIVSTQSMEQLAQPVLLVAALAVASSVSMGVRGGSFMLAFARLNLRIRNQLYRVLMRQEISFFDENHTGDVLSRLTSDTTQVSDLISQNINIFMRNVIKAAGNFAFMCGMSWKLTLVTVMGFPFISFVSKIYGDYYKKLTKEVQSTLAEANKVAEETISSMRTVRSFANEAGEAESYLSKLLLMFRLNRKQALAYACYAWFSSLAQLGMEVAVIYYGGHLVISNQMRSGDLIAFILYVLELAECLESVASVYTGLMQGVGAAEKVFEYLDREPTCAGLVEFRDVTFAYPSRPGSDILQGVSFTLRPGEVTALVGPSGGGKSSCVSLLENFYQPQRGLVLLDGKPVHTLRHDYLHSKVALVSQEPVLFARTVEENIAYGLVREAAVKANAHKFISELPRGYQTSVGEKGTHLSGGQKQRVAIARALVRDPRVLILDEATSALDAESEHMVQQALSSITQECTVLVVAHRLSTVEKAHNIVVLERGRVAEQGPHSRLMASGGLYSKLVQRQLLAME
uniref:ABC-type oligopeptide transporter ABCB9 n=1 Tax=Tetraodon nigroviridis TaxID=99883 RepID=H3DNF2_TETNG